MDRYIVKERMNGKSAGTFLSLKEAQRALERFAEEPEERGDYEIVTEERPVTRIFRIYGENGHRQRESFFASRRYDFSEDGHTRILYVKNADLTGTNDYTELEITMDTEEECFRELEGQITDGIFENSNTGRVEQIG